MSPGMVNEHFGRSQFVRWASDSFCRGDGGLNGSNGVVGAASTTRDCFDM